jgi:outer membrane protein OmpA-like peptidoglycan-associated protein
MRRVITVLILMLVAACQMPQQAAGPPQFVVFFRAGDAALSPVGRAVVDQIVAAARDQHPARIEVIGENDGITPAGENVADRRAANVVAALTKAGIDPAIVTSAGSVVPAGAGLPAHQVMVRFHPAAS